METAKPPIGVNYVGQYAVVVLLDKDILETQQITSLEEAMLPLVKDKANLNLIIDFGNVRFLSSSVLGLLIRICKRVREQSGTLKLCNIDPKIASIFKITRLDKVFDIYETVDKAME